MTAPNPTVKLNDGRRIPQLGFGVYDTPPGEVTYQATLTALKQGYRHLDTAHCYRNEKDVGRAIADSGIPREEIWVTTKLWKKDHGYESAVQACKVSLSKLGLTYLDLYLVHAPEHKSKRKDTWKAFKKLASDGLIKSAGVSNFGIHHLKEIIPIMKPSVNQLEVHPFGQKKDLVEFCNANDIRVEAYSPLTRSVRLSDPRLVTLSEKLGVSPAQLLLLWSLKSNNIPIVKSKTPSRIQQNLDVLKLPPISDATKREMDAWEENFCSCWNPTTWE
eukprot:TRINITY_DN4491_c2_g1_i1.p1 TRINITY_DN4491_c2_g1~~TRINITY_DN4491_c2_g1_i1.p1  ORF type:complete len:294 (+),score=54.02 TRINITY_DN4491_c2_g1_i1:60-884(+)